MGIAAVHVFVVHILAAVAVAVVAELVVVNIVAAAKVAVADIAVAVAVAVAEVGRHAAAAVAVAVAVVAVVVAVVAVAAVRAIDAAANAVNARARLRRCSCFGSAKKQGRPQSPTAPNQKNQHSHGSATNGLRRHRDVDRPDAADVVECGEEETDDIGERDPRHVLAATAQPGAQARREERSHPAGGDGHVAPIPQLARTQRASSQHRL